MVNAPPRPIPAAAPPPSAAPPVSDDARQGEALPATPQEPPAAGAPAPAPAELAVAESEGSPTPPRPRRRLPPRPPPGRPRGDLLDLAFAAVVVFVLLLAIGRALDLVPNVVLWGDAHDSYVLLTPERPVLPGEVALCGEVVEEVERYTTAMRHAGRVVVTMRPAASYWRPQVGLGEVALSVRDDTDSELASGSTAANGSFRLVLPVFSRGTVRVEAPLRPPVTVPLPDLVATRTPRLRVMVPELR